jgi:hypothetical protein
MEEKRIAYKGFDKDLKCRGFQYEVGKEYETDEAVACEMPLAVLNCYPPATSRYCLVEQSGEMDAHDGKTASTKLKVCAEIGIPGLVKAQVEWVRKHARSEKSASGYQSMASNSGDQSVASASGYRSVASNSGDQSVASNSGNQSVASNSGNRSVASASGDWSVASNSGDQSVASASGYRSVASNSGDQSVASASGDQSVASNSGNQSVASASGKASVAMASGIDGRVKGAVGCALFAVERGGFDGEAWPIQSVAAAIVDSEVIKADTWYWCRNGKLVEVDEDAR